MKRPEALEILIRHAARDVGGVGRGIRPEIKEQQRADVREAIIKIWREVHSWPITQNDLSNLGL